MDIQELVRFYADYRIK